MNLKLQFSYYSRYKYQNCIFPLFFNNSHIYPEVFIKDAPVVKLASYPVNFHADMQICDNFVLDIPFFATFLKT